MNSYIVRVVRSNEQIDESNYNRYIRYEIAGPEFKSQPFNYSRIELANRFSKSARKCREEYIDWSQTFNRRGLNEHDYIWCVSQYSDSELYWDKITFHNINTHEEIEFHASELVTYSNESLFLYFEIIQQAQLFPRIVRKWNKKQSFRKPLFIMSYAKARQFCQITEWKKNYLLWNCE